MCKCFLQFTAVAISVKFKLEEPRRALSWSAEPCPEEPSVLPGLTCRADGSRGALAPAGLWGVECLPAAGAQDSEVWY